MIRGLLVLLCWLVTAPAWAVQTTTFATSASATPWSVAAAASVSITINAGDRVCAVYGLEINNRSTVSVADDGSNSYTLVLTRDVGLNLPEIWGYCAIATAGATAVTVTLDSTSASNGVIYVWTVTESGAIGNSSSGQTNPAGLNHSSGTVTLTDASAMLLGGTVCIPNCSFTNDVDYGTADANTVRGIAAHRLLTGASDSYDVTSAGNEATATVLIEVRPAGGAQTFGFRKRLQVNP